MGTCWVPIYVPNRCWMCVIEILLLLAGARLVFPLWITSGYDVTTVLIFFFFLVDFLTAALTHPPEKSMFFYPLIALKKTSLCAIKDF